MNTNLARLRYTRPCRSIIADFAEMVLSKASQGRLFESTMQFIIRATLIAPPIRYEDSKGPKGDAKS